MLRKVEKWFQIHIQYQINININQFLWITHFPCLPSLINIHQRICELSCRQAEHRYWYAHIVIATTSPPLYRGTNVIIKRINRMNE